MEKKALPDDYSASAKRHRSDAEFLAGSDRYDNAGHLIGIAAECAMKLKLREIDKTPHQNYDGHHPRVQSILRTKLRSRGMTGPWLAFSQRQDLFPMWDISDRYSCDNKVTKESYVAWKSTADQIFSLAKIK